MLCWSPGPARGGSRTASRAGPRRAHARACTEALARWAESRTVELQHPNTPLYKW